MKISFFSDHGLDIIGLGVGIVAGKPWTARNLPTVSQTAEEVNSILFATVNSRDVKECFASITLPFGFPKNDSFSAGDAVSECFPVALPFPWNFDPDLLSVVDAKVGNAWMQYASVWPSLAGGEDDGERTAAPIEKCDRVGTCSGHEEGHGGQEEQESAHFDEFFALPVDMYDVGDRRCWLS